MNDKISIGAWQEAAASADSVQKISRTDLCTGLTRLTAHVTGSFGFVHHPVLELDEASGLVTGFSCDCWKYRKDGKLCVHAAALLAKSFGENRFELAPDAGLRFSGESDAAGPETPEGDFAAVEVTGETADGETVTLQGRMRCGFGFVHHPSITLTDGAITDWSCDCYQAAESSGPCPHCRLLRRKYRAGHGLTEAPPEESVEPDSAPVFRTPFADELAEPMEPSAPAEPVEPEVPFAPRSMQIVLGDDRQTGEKVYWRPNDTEQLVHMNTGILGTMGTGKTQLTKSILCQLFRQQKNNFDGHALGILVFDYKGDYNETKPEFVRATNARVLKLEHLPYNPLSLRGLAPKPQLPYHVASAFSGILTKIYHLGPVQYNLLLESIITAYERQGITSDSATWRKEAPTFEQVYQVYREADVKQDALYSAMYTLHKFELFEPEPLCTQSLYDLLSGVVVFDLSGYDERIQNLTVAITLETFCAQMLNLGSSRSDGQYRQLTKIILVDEADNIMSEGFGALKTILKEGREFGVGTILSTQSLHHFGVGDADYAGYILTWIVHAVPDLKKSDAEFMFKVPGAAAERLAQELADQKKHESIARIGNSEPVYLSDLPFWRIADGEDAQDDSDALQ